MLEVRRLQLADAGARYQHARTLVLAGGNARAEGETILEELGAAPMAVCD